MSDDRDIDVRIQEIEQRISDGEKSLLLAKNEIMVNWMFVAFSIGITIFIRGNTIIPNIGGIFLLCLNGWRVYRSLQKRKEIEASLRSHRGKKAELEAALTREE